MGKSVAVRKVPSGKGEGSAWSRNFWRVMGGTPGEAGEGDWLRSFLPMRGFLLLKGF